MFLQTQHLPAPSGTWAAAANGNWSDPSKWVGNVIADGANNFAYTPNLSGGTWTITVDTDRTIGYFQGNCNDPNWQTSPARIWVLGGTNTLTLSSSAAPAPGAGPRIRSVNGLTRVNCVIGGTGGLCAPDQAGIVQLNAANTYSGDTVIYRGRIQIGNVDALPHGSRTGNVILWTGGNPGNNPILDLRDFDITINGLSSNTNNLSNGALPQVTSFSSTSGTSTLTLGDNNATATYDGTIDDGPFGRTLAVTKIGTGTQTLNGLNTFMGPTTVQAGALIINGNHYSPVTVDGGLLGGNGTLYNSVTVNAGGTISAGGSIGILHLIAGLDLSAGGTNLWELVANSDANPGTDFDQIELAGGTLDLSDSTLVVSLGGSVNPSDPFWTSPRSWNVITSATGSGSSNFKTVKVQGSVPAGTFTTTNDGTNVKLLFTPGGAPPQPPPTPVRITAIVGAGTPAVTVHYTNTIPGSNYVLQAASSLTAPVSWVNVSTNQAVGTTGSAVDNTAGSSAQRYYRVFYHYAP